MANISIDASDSTDSKVFGHGALGGTRTPTILLTATSRQRVYQFRHERLVGRPAVWACTRPDQPRGCNKSGLGVQGPGSALIQWRFGQETVLPATRCARQHPLDFDGDAIAIDKHDAAGDRQVVGE